MSPGETRSGTPIFKEFAITAVAAVLAS